MKYLVKYNNLLQDGGTMIHTNNPENAIKEFIDESGLGIINNGSFTVFEVVQTGKSDFTLIDGKSFNVHMDITITENK